jgi:hypothetical protein
VSVSSCKTGRWALRKLASLWLARRQTRSSPAPAVLEPSSPGRIAGRHTLDVAGPYRYLLIFRMRVRATCRHDQPHQQSSAQMFGILRE